MGRMILTYAELLRDASEGKSSGAQESLQNVQRLHDGARKGLPSGCYPLDPLYKNSEMAEKLKNSEGKMMRMKKSFGGRNLDAKWKELRRRFCRLRRTGELRWRRFRITCGQRSGPG